MLFLKSVRQVSWQCKTTGKFSLYVCMYKEGMKLNQLFFMNCCRNCSFFFMSNFWYILTQSKVPRVFFLHSFIVICCIRLRNGLSLYYAMNTLHIDTLILLAIVFENWLLPCFPLKAAGANGQPKQLCGKNMEGDNFQNYGGNDQCMHIIWL